MKTSQEEAKINAAAKKFDDAKMGWLGATIRGCYHTQEAREQTERIMVLNSDPLIKRTAWEALALL